MKISKPVIGLANTLFFVTNLFAILFSIFVYITSHAEIRDTFNFTEIQKLRGERVEAQTLICTL